MDRDRFTKALWQYKLARDLTPNAYLVGRFLLRHTNKRALCWPSLATIAEGIGCSAKTVSRSIADLRDLGLLVWTQRKGRAHRRASNLYELRLPSKEGREKLLESSSATMSHGLLSPAMAAALVRLGAAIGVDAGAVMPWLAE